jgi:hypothetical protein
MDARHRHNMNHAYAATDTQEDAKAAYADTAARLWSAYRGGLRIGGIGRGARVPD